MIFEKKSIYKNDGNASCEYEEKYEFEGVRCRAGKCVFIFNRTKKDEGQEKEGVTLKL